MLSSMEKNRDESSYTHTPRHAHDLTRQETCNVLMVYPLFNPNSFWNYRETCEVVGARYPAAPLGLITVAALLPPAWNVRLVNRNTGDLDPADLVWADLVMTGGMLPQQRDALRIIDLAHELGKPVVVGGPDVSSSPHWYSSAGFQVLGEAEEVLGTFVGDWSSGVRTGVYRATRSEEHTSELQSPLNLVCRLLLE